MYNVYDFDLNDVWVNEYAETFTYYFYCPLGFLEEYVDLQEVKADIISSGQLTEEDFNITKGEISIETDMAGEWLSPVSISPVVEYDGGNNVESIDWRDIGLDEGFVRELLNSAKRKEKADG